MTARLITLVRNAGNPHPGVSATDKAVLRKRDQSDEPRVMSHGFMSGNQRKGESNRPPRWLVTLGVLTYCAVAWVVVLQVGAAAVRAMSGPQVEVASAPSPSEPNERR